MARLRASAPVFRDAGIELVGLETARVDTTGRESDPSDAPVAREILFDKTDLSDLSPGRIHAAVQSALERINPDVIAINSYSFPDARACLQWCLRHRRGAVLMTDSRLEDAPRTLWRERVKQILVSQFGAALVAGQPHRRYVRGLGLSDEQIFDGYDVVDNDFFATRSEEARANRNAQHDLPGLESDIPFFLSVGRLIDRKDFPTLIEAYRRYRSSVANPWRLILLGDGYLRPQIEQTIRAERISGITLAGWQPHDRLPAYYGLAAALVHQASTDQWGLVVNEAMAAGLPVIVSEGSGCAEDLVVGKGSGLSFPTGDAAGLAAHMAAMSSDSTARDGMAARAREVISAWPLKRFSESLLEASELAVRNARAGSLSANAVLSALRIASRNLTSFHSVEA